MAWNTYLSFREIDKVEKRSKILFSKQFSTVTNFMEKEACELGRNRWKSKCSQITYTRKKMKKKNGRVCSVRVKETGIN